MPRATQRIQLFLPRQSSWFAGFLTLFAVACDGEPNAEAASGPSEQVRVRAGIEVVLTDSAHLINGKRLGLMTNHTGIFWQDPERATGPQDPGPGETITTIDALNGRATAQLVALFAPEHGIRGDEEGGLDIEDGIDDRTGVPIHSVYGAVRKPTPEMLEGVDVLLFDMQDIGARYYTYVSTMALAMEAAGEAGIPFVVLDRPNPIRGDVLQGNTLDPEYSTFVGMYPVPMRHGMTTGELARMYVGAFGIEVDLHVVPLDGWTRDMTYDQTGLPWVAPSPNMPALPSALAYPGTCLFEGTPISVGRGTDRAFEWVGAPWLDGEALASALNLYGIEGVRFEATTFTPTNPGDGKFDGEEVAGVRIVAEATDYDATAVGVALLIETRAQSGERWFWREAHFDRLAGSDALRRGLDAEVTFQQLTAGWSEANAAFAEFRAPYLIY